MREKPPDKPRSIATRLAPDSSTIPSHGRRKCSALAAKKIDIHYPNKYLSACHSLSVIFLKNFFIGASWLSFQQFSCHTNQLSEA
jgi:hypothetical protein